MRRRGSGEVGMVTSGTARMLAMGATAAAALLLWFGGGVPRVASAQAESYDLVIANGRVMDPESGLDAVRNVGIRGGKIAAIILKFAALQAGGPIRTAA